MEQFIATHNNSSDTTVMSKQPAALQRTLTKIYQNQENTIQHEKYRFWRVEYDIIYDHNIFHM